MAPVTIFRVHKSDLWESCNVLLWNGTVGLLQSKLTGPDEMDFHEYFHEYFQLPIELRIDCKWSIYDICTRKINTRSTISLTPLLPTETSNLWTSHLYVYGFILLYQRYPSMAKDWAAEVRGRLQTDFATLNVIMTLSPHPLPPP